MGVVVHTSQSEDQLFLSPLQRDAKGQVGPKRVNELSNQAIEELIDASQY
jgi:hypothetical protein